jgi:very-short-patch-repair endonuclease
VRAGWLVIRFAWEHVMFDAEWVAAVVREVVAARDEARAA